MDVYFNKNNSVKIQQEFFHLSSTILIGCFVLEFSQPSHAHKFHANAKYQLVRTKAEPVCTTWRMSVSAVVTNGGEPYAKRWAPETATGHSLAAGAGAWDWRSSRPLLSSCHTVHIPEL